MCMGIQTVGLLAGVGVVVVVLGELAALGLGALLCLELGGAIQGSGKGEKPGSHGGSCP